MDKEFWQKLDKLYNQILDLPEEEKDTFIEEYCRDEIMRRELISLLKNEEDSARYFDSLSAEVIGQAYEALPDLFPVAGRAGNYRILDRLGTGGMGSVYLAERDDKIYESRVAVKIMHRELGGGEVLARFQAERQILANLNHPNITHLLDGGLTEAGQPYFVMEYVEGIPITNYCNENRLGIPEQLALFKQVCDALQYAHQNLVVHRDLKPGNILVTENGQVKLLDFGIASLLVDKSTGNFTSGKTAKLMTPGWASPEQLQELPITTVSDIYQLGILLYELLSGFPPFTFSNRSLENLKKAVLGQIPVPPSHRVKISSAAEIFELDAAASISLRKKRNVLKGDLDAIILKALHPEPDLRYASVKNLGDDIHKYISGFPVLARGNRLRYICGKFLKRHLISTAMAVVFFVLLLALGVAHSLSITKERDIAVREAAKAEQVSDFLISLFEGVSSHEVDPNAISAVMILDAGIERSKLEAEKQPALSSHMMGVIGETYHTMGILDKAGDVLEQTLLLNTSAFGENSIETATTLNQLGYLQLRKFELDALATLKHSVLIQEGLKIPDQVLYANTLKNMADAITYLQQKSESSDELYLKHYKVSEKHYGKTHPETALARLGYLLGLQNYDQVQLEEAFRNLISIRQDVFGKEHPEVGDAMNSYGLFLEQYRPSESISLVEEALEIYVNSYGKTYDKSIVIQTNLAALFRDQGKFEEAESHYREVLELSYETKLEGSAVFIYRLVGLGRVLLAQGNPAAAEPYLREGLELFERHFKGYTPMIVITQNYLGQCLIELDNFEEAEKLLLSSFSEIRDKNSVEYNQALQILIKLYENWGKNEEAHYYSTLAAPPATVTDPLFE